MAKTVPMSDERLAELRIRFANSFSGGNGSDLRLCVAEIDRLRAELAAEQDRNNTCIETAQ